MIGPFTVFEWLGIAVFFGLVAAYGIVFMHVCGLGELKEMYEQKDKR